MLKKIINIFYEEGLISLIIRIYYFFFVRLYRLMYRISNFHISSSNKWLHFGVWGFKNAGDTVLYIEVEKIINCLSKNNFSFVKKDIHKEIITEDDIEVYNKKYCGIFIGGGGLFLKDTNINNNSGWQFNISTKSISKIEIPIVIFAVGYNRFRNQEDFEDVFKENLNAFAEKSVFLGLRNSGSIRAIKELLPEVYHHKIFYQPCPTTVINKIYGLKPLQQEKKKRIIAVNIAFDRHKLRFGNDMNRIINEIIEYSRVFSRRGFKVLFIGHCSNDKEILNYAKSIDFLDLTRSSPKKIKQFYREIYLSVGMRGHAQMIPFGLGTPILSLISHDKMKYFLQDINRLEWGIEVTDSFILDKLIRSTNEILGSYKETQNLIHSIQHELFSLTQRNLEIIKEQI